MSSRQMRRFLAACLVFLLGSAQASAVVGACVRPTSAAAAFATYEAAQACGVPTANACLAQCLEDKQLVDFGKTDLSLAPPVQPLGVVHRPAIRVSGLVSANAPGLSHRYTPPPSILFCCLLE